MASGTALLAMALAFASGRAAHPDAPDTRRVWYPSGQLAESRPFSRGKETGIHRGWWPDGAMHFTYAYHEGLLEGTSREWYPSGALWREQHYRAGHEDGLQRLYWEDGRVRASYVVRDGRRFGLMGAKGCVTRGDSIQAGLL